jgi:hypothetical protein
MKLPGSALLDFSIAKETEETTCLRLSAHFRPSGLAGILYWYMVLPFHGLVFNGMLRGIGQRLERKIVSGPKRVRLKEK